MQAPGTGTESATASRVDPMFAHGGRKIVPAPGGCKPERPTEGSSSVRWSLEHIRARTLGVPTVLFSPRQPAKKILRCASAQRACAPSSGMCSTSTRPTGMSEHIKSIRLLLREVK